MLKYSIISFWNGYVYNDNMFTHKFCNKHLLTFNYEESNFIIIGSFVNENEYNLIKNLKCKKILYITEPIEFFNNYAYTYKLYIENDIDFITGCINNDISNNRYKYPLYLCYINLSDKNIFNIINNYVKHADINEKKFCTLINTHDNKNTRTPIYNILKEIDNIICPSILFNNCSDEELNKIGNNEFLKKFKFNICSENCLTNINGYITEKLINCCMGGSIPIYCGSFDEIDEKIFNKERILFYDSFNESTMNYVKDKILSLINNEEEFNKFYKQDVFCKDSFEHAKLLEDNLIDFFDNKLFLE
jgi:hypothetical protein